MMTGLSLAGIMSQENWGKRKTGETTNMYRLFVGKPLGSPKQRCKDDINLFHPNTEPDS
jgi:hypothetical protein